MKKYSKYLLVAVAAVFSLSLAVPNADAVTIAELMAQIQALQAQLAQLQAQQGTTTAWCHDFNTNLRIGDNNDEVSALLNALVKDGVTSERSSNFSSDFDETIASAVSEFQEKYASEILTPYRLKRGTGFVGKSTRAKLNKLYGCGVATPTPTPTPIPTVTPAPTPLPVPTTPAPSLLKLSSPMVNETISAGNSYTIRWNATRDLMVAHSHVDIILEGATSRGCYPSGCGLGPQKNFFSKVWDELISLFTLQNVKAGSNFTLASNVDISSGFYVWSVPSNITNLVNSTDGTYKFQFVDSQTKQEIYPYTDNIFKFSTSTPTTPPSITVLSPNGGEVWEIGKTYEIKWKANNIGNTVAILIQNYNINNDPNFRGWGTEWKLAPNNGSYQFTVPLTAFSSNTYKVTIQKTDAGYDPIQGIDTDSSDAFRIEAATATTPASTSAILTVIRSGTGSGTVSDNLGYFSCGSDCSNNFGFQDKTGTILILTAIPATGSVFTGWSSACSGTGSCTVTMDANKFVTATFTTTTTTTTPAPIAINNTSLTVQRLFPGQYDNTKYNVITEDPDGIQKITVKKADGSILQIGDPPCSTKVETGTVTFLSSDFPLVASVNDCKDPSVVHVTQAIMPPLSTAGTTSVLTASMLENVKAQLDRIQKAINNWGR